MGQVYVRDTLRVSDIAQSATQDCNLYVERIGKRFRLLVVKENGDGSGDQKMWRWIPETFSQYEVSE